MPEDEGYLKVPEGVDLLLETRPGSNSLQWEECRRDVNSVLDEIKVGVISQTGKPRIILGIVSDGVYRVSPVDCEIDSYSIRNRPDLKGTQEEKSHDEAVLTTTRFAFPIKIILNYRQENGRLYYGCMRIKEGHIRYFGD